VLVGILLKMLSKNHRGCHGRAFDGTCKGRAVIMTGFNVSNRNTE